MSNETKKKSFWENPLVKLGLADEVPEQTGQVEQVSTPTATPIYTTQVSPQQGVFNTQPQYGTSGQGVIAVADPKYVAHIEKAFQDANIPGPDYYEFSKSLEATASMGDMIPAKGRYQMAFLQMTASAPDLKKEYLIDTGKKYIEVLDAELNEFKIELDKIRTKEIGSRQEEITKLNKDNLAKAKQIEEITAQMQANQSKCVEISNEINTKTLDIEQMQKNFELVHLNKSNLIKAEIDNINSFIENKQTK